MSQIGKVYLLAYNLVMLVATTFAFLALLTDYVEKKDFGRAYYVSHEFLAISIFGSLLETVHAALGLTGGGPAQAFTQWAGRALVFYLVRELPDVQGSVPASTAIWAWSASEPVRYFYLLLNSVGLSPYWLLWVRYTQFIPLYPLGMLGELGTLYLSAPHVQTLPAAIPIPHPEYVIYALCVLWPIAWFPLYMYMFRQRRNKLGSAPAPAPAPAPAKRD